MRILFVTDWTSNVGGIEAYVTRATEGLEALGHEVRLLTSSVAPPARGGHYVAFGTDNLAAQAFLQIANPFAVAAVRKALREFRPDVVQVNMFEKYLSPAIFEALRGTPTVAVVHYYKPICPIALKLLPDGSVCEVPAGLVCWRSGCVGMAEWLRDRPRYALIRSGLALAQRVLACSRWMVGQLGQNGIAAEAFALPVPAPGAGFIRAPSPDAVFLYCGRLDREKGVDVLLHAFARARMSQPHIRLRVLGGGPRLEALRTLADRLGIGEAARFEGRVSFVEVDAALAEAWALVAPSIWPEPLGLVAIEAISRGVPVIASASGGFLETVVDGVSGHLVRTGDELALADSLVSAVDAGPTTLPDEVVQELRQRHDAGEHARRLTEVLQSAIEAHRPHPSAQQAR